MTKIKLCGLSRPEDIEAANMVQPDFVGFVFAPNSKRYVTHQQAKHLRALLSPQIQAVGVFVDEQEDAVAALLNSGVIQVAQLHGNEDSDYIRRLRRLTGGRIMKAFKITGERDVLLAEASIADEILLDAGAGTGTMFDWDLLRDFSRPYFLAGGLDTENVGEAVRRLRPFAVDVSSGIETDGKKDSDKMAAFVAAVRKEDEV